MNRLESNEIVQEPDNTCPNIMSRIFLQPGTYVTADVLLTGSVVMNFKLGKTIEELLLAYVDI